MANEEKMRLGFDLSDTQRGAQVLIEIFNKINKGIQAVGLESVHLTNKGQLISASFKAMTEDGRQFAAQMKKTTESLLAFTAEGKLRTSTGNFASIPKSFAITGLKGLGINDMDKVRDQAIRMDEAFNARRIKAQYELDRIVATRVDNQFNRENKLRSDAARLDAAFNAKKIQAQSELDRIIATRMDNQFNRENKLRSDAARLDAAFNAKKIQAQYQLDRIVATRMDQRFNRENKIRSDAARLDAAFNAKKIQAQYQLDRIVATRMDKQFNREKLLQQKRDLEIHKLENAKTGFDKFFNQAAAITSGIVISQVFFGITSAMQQSITTATQFQIKLSEIRTISQENQLSLAGWAKEVRGLSDAFGADILDVTAGLYEAVSNQIAKGAEVTGFMAEAMLFGAVTVTNTQNAVNLLSSGLNAYNLTVDHSRELSASFFTLIDLGRVRADEIANSIGTVYAISSKLGISFNEVNASLAVMTIQGVKANNAMTYLRNVFIQLLKPSGAMKENFKAWGVSSGEAAIQTYGFTGVLEKLNKIVEQGGLEELANDLKRIRAILGGALLTGKNTLNYEQALKKFETANVRYANATKIAFESSGKTLTIEFNKIKNLILESFGTRVVDSVAAFSKSIGGLANALEVVTKALIAGTVAWGAYRIAMISARNAGALVGSALGSLKTILAFATSNIGLLAISVGTIVYKLQNIVNPMELIKEKTQEVANEMAEVNAQVQEQFTKLGKKATENLDKAFNPIFRDVAETRVKLTDLADHALDKFKEVNKAIESSTGKFVDKLTEDISKAKTELQLLNQIAKESESFSRGFVKKRNDNRFEDSIEDSTTTEKAQAEFERAQSRFTTSKQLFEDAKRLMTEGSVKAANDAFRDARAMLEEALTLADRAQKNNLKSRKEYAKTLKEVTDDLEQAQKKRARIAESLDDTLRFSKATPRNQDKVKDLREEFKKIQKEIADLEVRKAEIVGKGTPTALREQETKILERQREIETSLLAAEREMQEIVKQRAIDRENEIEALQESKKISKELFKEALKIEFKPKDTDEQKVAKLEQFRKLSKQIEDVVAGTDLTLGDELGIIKLLAEKEKVLQTELGLKKEIKNLDDKRLEIEKARQQAEEQITKTTDKNLAQAKTLAEQTEKVIASIRAMRELAPWSLGAETRATEEATLKALEEIIPRLQSTNITARQLALEAVVPKLDAAIKLFESKMTIGRDGKPAATSFTSDAKQSVADAALQAAIEANQALGTIQALKTSQKDLLKVVYDEINDLSTESTKKQTNDVKIMIDNHIKEYQRWIETLKQGQGIPLIAPTSPVRQAFGGGARGLDTVPAMLTPGEFVVNAGAARRFYSQLVAMNSGNVRHMAHGGPVSNNRFGDINVTVAGGKSSTTTARDIGLALRRELKRGTIPPL